MAIFNGSNGDDNPHRRRRQRHPQRRQRQRHPQRRRRQRHPQRRPAATTRSWAVKAPTRRSSAPATTCSSGIRATAMTRSTAAAASTRSTSSANTTARPSASIGQRLRGEFIRAGGNIGLTGVERIQFEAQGQHADNITINDLTGTGVEQVAIDVGAGAGSAGAMVRWTRFTSTRPTATRSRSPTKTAWSRCRVWPAT